MRSPLSLLLPHYHALAHSLLSSSNSTLPPIWAIPSLELAYCPSGSLDFRCTSYTISFLVNIGRGQYEPAAGNDTRCRAEQSIGPKVPRKWTACDEPALQWRWEDAVDDVTSSMSMWPRDEQGYAHVGLRLLEGEPVGDEVEVWSTSFTFRETTRSGGRPDAVVGCPMIDRIPPVICSMGEFSVFGFEPPQPIIMTNVTHVKMKV